MIIASGFNIYPKEIDELLMTHPKVLEVCTIGIPTPTGGDRENLHRTETGADPHRRGGKKFL